MAEFRAVLVDRDGNPLGTATNPLKTSGGGTGTSDHALLTNRDAADQHPVSAITGAAPLDSPTFTTQIITPLLIGGIAVGSNLTYKSTIGTGTPSGIAHQFTGGTNGGTILGTILNNGNFGIGLVDPESRLHISSSGVANNIFQDAYGQQNNLIGRRAQGTVGVQTAILSGNTFLQLSGRGHDGTSMGSSSRVYMQMNAAQNWRETANGTYIRFYTTANDTVTTAERLRIENDGKVGIGITEPLTHLHVADTSILSPRGVLSSQHSDSTDGARYGLMKSRGTPTSPTTVLTEDMLGRLRFHGFDGTNYLEMGSINVGVSGTVAATRVPTFISFSTATDATPSVLTERMRIDNSGLVGIGTVSPAHVLDIQATTNQRTIYGLSSSMLATNLQSDVSSTGNDETLADRYYAWKFIASAAHTMGSLSVRLKKVGTITNTTDYIRLKLYSDSTGTPNSLLWTSDQMKMDSLTTSYVEYFFGGDYTLVNGNTYWIVVERNAAVTGGGSIAVDRNGTALTTTNVASPITSDWTVSAGLGRFVLYGQSPIAVSGFSRNQAGGYFSSSNGYGVQGVSTSGVGGYFSSINNYGVYGVSTSASGLYGLSTNGPGIQGTSTAGNGILGTSVSSAGIYCISTNGWGALIYQAGALSGNNANSTLLLRRFGATAVGSSYTGSVLQITDNPTGTGVVSGALISGIINSTERFQIDPRVADGATAVLGFIDSLNTLSTTGAKLFSFRNAGVEKAYVGLSGGAYFAGNVGIGTPSPRGKLDVFGLYEAYFGYSNSACALVLGNSRRLNYADVLIARNLVGVTGNDTYKIVETDTYAGYSAIEFRALGDILFFADAGPTVKDTIVTPKQNIIIKGPSGFVGIGVTTPTAVLHLKAGTNAAGTAPLKLTTGTVLDTPEAGSIEYDGSHYYGTIGATRQTVAMVSDLTSAATWNTISGSFTATPASTSTLTMTSDQTATLKVGYGLRYTVGGVVYYGIIKAITSNLLTIAGAPFSGNVTGLAWCNAKNIIQKDFYIPSTYEDASNNGLLLSDAKTRFVWRLPEARLVCISHFNIANDSGETKPCANMSVGGNKVATANTNEGLNVYTGWTDTVVDINTTNYVVATGSAVEVTTAMGSVGNATHLTISGVFVLV